MCSSLYVCTFESGGWDPGDWTQVRSPRWDHDGGWDQRADHISNCVPADASAEQLQGPRADETYSSMVLAGPPIGEIRVRTRASFDFRMAPLVVLAGPLGTDLGGHPEYREHVEIVLFDEGVNVWHHTWSVGDPTWVKAAWWRCELARGEWHALEVQWRGSELALRVGDREFGCRIAGLPDEVHPGITGCEGVNRFCEFAVDSLEK